jgi:hypothetical protein
VAFYLLHTFFKGWCSYRDLSEPCIMIDIHFTLVHKLKHSCVNLSVQVCVCLLIGIIPAARAKAYMYDKCISIYIHKHLLIYMWVSLCGYIFICVSIYMSIAWSHPRKRVCFFTSSHILELISLRQSSLLLGTEPWCPYWNLYLSYDLNGTW